MTSRKQNNAIWEASMLVLLMGEIYEVRHWDGLRCHDIHTTFYDDMSRHASNTKVIDSKVWEAAVLVLLVGGICEVYGWDGRRWHGIHTNFHDSRHWSDVMVTNKNGVVTVTWMFLLFHSQHVSDQIGCHQMIREEHTNDDWIHTYTYVKLQG
jgi:hypothetical protein